MAQGGARSRSGPPPDPNALRRDRPSDAAGWITLPAEGRLGVAPEWPLPSSSRRELEVWAAEWSRPQAVQWERMGLADLVADFVRCRVEAEGSDAPVSLRTLVKQLREELGISPSGLARHRWRIAAVPVEAPPAEAGSNVVSARDRFRSPSVEPGA